MGKIEIHRQAVTWNTKKSWEDNIELDLTETNCKDAKRIEVAEVYNQ
jgi:hypothetical protein